MDLMFEITRNTYQASSLLSNVAVGRGDVLASKSSYKERDTWKGKCGVMKQKCFSLQKDMTKLQNKIKHVDSLREEVKTYNSPSNLVACVTNLEVAFKAQERHYQDASNFVTEKTRQANEDQKTFQRVIEAQVKALKILKDEVVGLNMTHHDFVQHTMQFVLGVHDQVVEHVKRFFPTTDILVQDMNPFQDAPEGVQDSVLGTSAPDAST